MKFIDAHCHLEHEMFSEDLPKVIERNKEKIKFVIDCGGSIDENTKILKISSENKGFVYPAISIAPHFYQESFEELEKQVLANSDTLIALGELGLDLHHFTRETLPAQENVFKQQLALAERLSLPVIVHSRNAEKECIDILNSYDLKVQMHCFFKANLLDKINFKHVISIPTLKSKDVIKTMSSVALENVVFETDSPFLWSVEGKFVRNEPMNVGEVYSRFSVERKVSLDDLIIVVENNLRRVFTGLVF